MPGLTTQSQEQAENEATKTVLDAIKQANYADNGAPFRPLLIKLAQPTDFSNIWFSERGDTPIAFYQFQGRPDGFCPLGDQAVTDNDDWAKVPVLLFQVMPGFEDALKNPSDFNWILDDKGSHNNNDLVYWWPIAPEGYTALGIAISGSGDAKPNASHYWCVKNIYLKPAESVSWWNDSGQGWHHNGNLSVPKTTPQMPEEEGLLLAPTTLLSDECPRECYALSLTKCLLPVPEDNAPEPVYNSSNNQGTVTD